MAIDLTTLQHHKKKAAPPDDKDSIWQREIFSFSKKFGKKRKESYYTELNILLDSGIQLTSALELIREGIKSKHVSTILQKMLEALMEGKELSEAKKDHAEFTNYEIQCIKIGEQSGKLSEVVKGLADYFREFNRQRSELMSALTYPIIVMSTAVLVVVFMLKFVVPIFKDMFNRNQVELPWITRIVLSSSELIEDNFWLMLLSVVGLVFLFRFVTRSDAFKRIWGDLLMRIPIFGNMVLHTHLSRFIGAMSLLSKAKINITQSLEMVRDMTDFYPLKDAIGKATQSIIEGSSQAQAFAGHPKLFDSKFVAMIKVSEETNQNELVYENLKFRYEEVLKNRSKSLTNILNPILTLFIGFVVGFILIALYLPMFKMSTLIG